MPRDHRGPSHDWSIRRKIGRNRSGIGLEFRRGLRLEPGILQHARDPLDRLDAPFLVGIELLGVEVAPEDVSNLLRDRFELLTRQLGRVLHGGFLGRRPGQGLERNPHAGLTMTGMPVQTGGSSPYWRRIPARMNGSRVGTLTSNTV